MTPTDRQLQQYWRANPHDETAQQAYLDRLNQSPRPIITKLDDPDFDQKLLAEIQRQRQATSK